MRHLLWFFTTLLFSHASPPPGPGPAKPLPLPPMGFMSWENFRCHTDCETYPNACINEELYLTIGQALVDTGLRDAGYTQVSIDDCWSDGRDPDTNELLPNADRFPRGMKALADDLHDMGLKFGLYGDAGTKTCGGYAGSRGYEEIDVKTLVKWGVDYFKLDGCYIKDTSNASDPFSDAYLAFGQALREHSNSTIAYSCSWPAYLGSNESSKPYAKMYHEAGCNTWRNWGDIDNTWDSLKAIVKHFGKYSPVWMDVESGIFPVQGMNDADMILAGDTHYNSTLSINQAKIQLTVWSILKSPLFLAADIRQLVPSKDNPMAEKLAPFLTLMKNEGMIEVSQDVLSLSGGCAQGCQPGGKQQEVESDKDDGDVQLWRRTIVGGVAVALVNLGSDEQPVGSFLKEKGWKMHLPSSKVTVKRIWDDNVDYDDEDENGETEESFWTLEGRALVEDDESSTNLLQYEYDVGGLLFGGGPYGNVQNGMDGDEYIMSETSCVFVKVTFMHIYDQDNHKNKNVVLTMVGTEEEAGAEALTAKMD